MHLQQHAANSYRTTDFIAFCPTHLFDPVHVPDSNLAPQKPNGIAPSYFQLADTARGKHTLGL